MLLLTVGKQGKCSQFICCYFWSFLYFYVTIANCDFTVTEQWSTLILYLPLINPLPTSLLFFKVDFSGSLHCLTKLTFSNWEIILPQIPVMQLATINNLKKLNFSASWSSGNAFVSGAGGPRFKSLAGQIKHSVTNGSPSLGHFSKGAVLPTGAMTRRWAPPTRCTSRRNAAGLMKDWIWFFQQRFEISTS